MSKVLLFTVLLLSTTWIVAQDSSTSGSQSSQPGSSSSQGDQSSNAQSGMSSGSETSIEGCLSGSAGSYTLTSSTGTSYQLTGSDDLSKHVNQQVRVKGTQSGSSASSSATPSSSSSASSPSSTSGASQPAFNVSKVSKISDTCSTSNK